VIKFIYLFFFLGDKFDILSEYGCKSYSLYVNFEPLLHYNYTVHIHGLNLKLWCASAWVLFQNAQV